MKRVHWSVGLAAVALLIASGAVAQTKDTLVVGVTLEPSPGLDPTAGAAAAIDEIVYANVFEGLTRIDENGAVQPQLATDWTVSEDGLEYVFNLKTGLKFHDGTDFDAEDVVFSLNRARAEDSTNAQKQLFEAIASVEAIDPATVKVALSRPEGSLLFNLGWGDAVIVAPESAENNGTNPVGTGPFKFDSWVPGDRVELSRFDDRVALEKVVFRFIPDPSAQVAALQAGDIDAIPNIAQAPEAFLQFQADPNFVAVAGSTEGETILTINNARPPFDDIRVRRAIAHAIDRQAIVDGAMFGFGTPIGTHFAPHHPAYVDLTGNSPHDPDAARALLAEAGFDDGLQLTIKLPPPTYARRGGELIAAQLADVGVEAELIPVEWAQWLEQVFRGDDFDLTIVSHTEPLDIGIYGREDYYFNYSSDAFNDVMEQLRNTSDLDKRNELFGEAQRIIAEDAVNGYLFQLAKLGVWRNGLEGLWANSPIQANDVTNARWVE